MQTKHIGMLLVMLAAVIFGLASPLGKRTFSGGSNPFMATFLRAFFAIPVLLAILVWKKIPMRLSPKERKQIFLLGGVGSALTTCLIYASFHYIPVGIATAIYYAYPAFVLIASSILFREKISPGKIGILILITAGVLLTCDLASLKSMLGVVLALASAGFYAFAMLYQYHSGLVYMEAFKLCFYQCCSIAASMLAISLATGNFTLALSAPAWGISVLMALMVSVGALAALQCGLKYVGSVKAAFFHTVEPLSTIFFGWVILGEVLSAIKLAGCALILTGVVLMALVRTRQ